MAPQHDMVLENGPGGAWRADLNNALAALFSNNSGPSQPTVTLAGQFWFDTSSATNWTLWIRNGSDSDWVRLFDLSASAVIGMGLQELSGMKQINGGPLGLRYRNNVINGDFDIWQRNITQTSNGYGSDDRWVNSNTGSTKVHSRQTFALGQVEVPGNPKYYSRTVVTSVAGVANFCAKTQRMEGVQTFSGKTVTVTLYAKADAAKNIGVSMYQYFGTGGSPSATLYGIGAATLALTTAWKKFTWTAAVPSISGKVLGTSNSDQLALEIYFDAGANFDVRSNILGQQSGTFDISHVSIVEGDATQEADPFNPRTFQQELSMCQRFFECSFNVSTVVPTITTVGMLVQRFATMASLTTHTTQISVPFRVRKRAVPSITFYSPNTGVTAMGTSYFGTATDVAATTAYTGEMSCAVGLSDTRASTEVYFGIHWAAVAEF